MKYQYNLDKDTFLRVKTVNTPRGLYSIKNSKCAAVIWRRQPVSNFEAWINAIMPSNLPKARIILRPEIVRKAMVDLLEALKLPNCAEREMLIDDIAALANIFADIVHATYLRFKLTVIQSDVFTEFHQDQASAQLVCTYRGRGMHYEHSINGEKPREIYNVPTGSPIILRGTHWPELAISNVLHRPPQTHGVSDTMLVLTLDPVLDLEKQAPHHSMH